ncbi:MAG TPA: cytochrome b [Xanthobacteraceae bacterium]|jgi:cytochrome b561
MTQPGFRNTAVSAPTPTAASPVTRYSLAAIGLHWIMAALILFSGVLGLLLDDWPKASKLTWINIHAQVGLLVLALLIARIWWRRTHTPPQLPPEVSEISRRVSHPAHVIIYALMLVTPLVGIVAFVWHARVLDFGLFSIDFGVKSNGPVYHQAEDIHLWLTYGLFALVAGHAVAALWHHFISRDSVLLRMLPARFSARQSGADASDLVQAKSS